MGIYYGNQIFGVKLINNGHDIYVYEKDEELNEEEKQNIKFIYDQYAEQFSKMSRPEVINDVDEESWNKIYVQLCVDCTDTYDIQPSTYKLWIRATIEDLWD